MAKFFFASAQEQSAQWSHPKLDQPSAMLPKQSRCSTRALKMLDIIMLLQCIYLHEGLQIGDSQCVKVFFSRYEAVHRGHSSHTRSQLHVCEVVPITDVRQSMNWFH